jgi:hypothetical protein
VQARRHDLIGAKLLARPKSGVGGASMFQFLRGVVLIAAVTLNCGAAFAYTANETMPGCRAFLKDSVASGREGIEAGLCAGAVAGLVYAAPGVCVPKGADAAQAVRVVLQYIDSRPARMHENFMTLAAEALRAAWPCKK